MAFTRIPLNLPHAGTIATRIEYYIRRRIEMIGPSQRDLLEKCNSLIELLGPVRAQGENPAEAEARQMADDAAALCRAIIDGVEALDLKEDRLGQAVRNFFECLEKGEEGMEISLRAGEEPGSALRPKE